MGTSSHHRSSVVSGVKNKLDPSQIEHGYKSSVAFDRQIHNYMVVNKLSVLFSALSDPTRREILSMLATGALPVNELAKPFRLSQQAISKHVGLLEKSGLIVKSRVGRESICTVNPASLDEILDWAESYKKRWERSLNRLESYLQRNEKRKTAK